MGDLSVLGVEGFSSAILGCGVTGSLSGAQEDPLLYDLVSLASCEPLWDLVTQPTE